jgi:hypothetical protein
MSKIRANPGKSCPDVSFFVRGSFGSGKSHVLKYLERLALSNNFACSTVTVSKETPLGDSHHVYQSAANAMKLPDRPHGGLSEAVLKIDFTSRAYLDFYANVQSKGSALAPLFGVTLQLYEGIRDDPEFANQIVSYWAGNINRIFELRMKLRKLGASVLSVSTERGDRLAFQRFNFAAKLLNAVGYAGWVVLLDEVELVATFSAKARIRSYAVLAGLLGRVSQFQIPGLLGVVGITRDFEGEVVNIRKDRDRIELLRNYDDTELASNAIVGLETLRDDELHEDIAKVTSAKLELIAASVHELYAMAYARRPSHPTVNPAIDNMRIHIREWITRWDLERLDSSYQPTIEKDTLIPNLAENADIEKIDEDS